MIEQDFMAGIGRLERTYGKNSYSTERVKLIWREVKDFDPFWWERTIDDLIGSSRYAPLLTEIREHSSRERERQWEIQRERERQDAKDFFAMTYMPEDKAAICQTIIARLDQSVPDETWATFVKGLEHLSLAEARCKSCEDTGLRWTKDPEGHESVSRCYCGMGQRQPERPKYGKAQQS